MHSPSVKLVQESMLIRASLLLLRGHGKQTGQWEKMGGGEWGGGGLLSPLLLCPKQVCSSCHRGAVKLRHDLKRKGKGLWSAGEEPMLEASLSKRKLQSVCLLSHTPFCLRLSSSCFKSCLIPVSNKSVLFLPPKRPRSHHHTEVLELNMERLVLRPSSPLLPVLSTAAFVSHTLSPAPQPRLLHDAEAGLSTDPDIVWKQN